MIQLVICWALANNEKGTIKAAAGEPVVIDFNNAKTDLLKGHYYYLGHTQLNWPPAITTLMPAFAYY